MGVRGYGGMVRWYGGTRERGNEGYGRYGGTRLANSGPSLAVCLQSNYGPSGVSFFSHALMAARKRDDVQSYTDASHFTEEMSCQLFISET